MKEEKEEQSTRLQEQEEQTTELETTRARRRLGKKLKHFDLILLFFVHHMYRGERSYLGQNNFRVLSGYLVLL